MMRQLRESTKIIMVVVVVSFVALMVFDWAMDLSGRSAGGSPTAIGNVNGREIGIEEYQITYEALLEQAREQSPDGIVSDEQAEQIQEQAWTQVVNSTLLRGEADRRGIEVTDEDVLRYIQANPPAEMRESPAFQTDGAFDPAKYRQALANPQLAPTWALYEQNVREELPLQRLQEQVLAGVTLTDRELEEAYRTLHEQVRVDYLYLDPGVLVPDSAVEVTDEEVRAAYDERKEQDFRRRASARIQVVSWQAPTTAADTARVRVELDSLRARALAGESFEDLAQEYSQDPGSARRGGSLGLFGRGQMVPEFESVAFSTPPDSVSEPFASAFGWHIVQGGERTQDEAGAERTSARHILLRPEPSEETFAALEDSADAFAQDAQARSDAFQQLAREAGLEPDSVPPFEQSPFIPGLGRVPEVSQWVFDSPAGSVSEPLRDGAAVYVVKVEERTPAGFVPFATVQGTIRRELMMDEKLEQAAELEERATELVRERGLGGAAEALGLTVATAGPFARNAELPQIGGGNAFIGTAFGIQPGQTAGPIELENGIYFLEVTERRPADMAPFEEQRASYRQQILGERAQQVMLSWMRAIREEAEIEDYREDFLQTAESGEGDPAEARVPPLF
ncbi:MAG: peptidylprolyl isomerase [Gemmatimonadota bacterium]